MADFINADDLFYREYEPKLQNRYIMIIEGIPAFTIKTAGRPSLEFETVEIDHINTKRYVAGKGAWGTIDMTLNDPITPSAAQTVMEWVRLHYESTTGAMGYLENYKKDITIQVLGPPGDIVEQWIGKRAYITSAEFGDLDWSSNDPVEISLTLQCDHWILEF